MSFTLIKVGDKDRPATPEDIKDIITLVRDAKNDAALSIVTHHAIKFQEIGTPVGYTIVYKIGDKDTPAQAEDIADFQKELEEAHKEGRPVVCHHAVEIEYAKLTND